MTTYECGQPHKLKPKWWISRQAYSLLLCLSFFCHTTYANLSNNIGKDPVYTQQTSSDTKHDIQQILESEYIYSSHTDKESMTTNHLINIINQERNILDDKNRESMHTLLRSSQHAQDDFIQFLQSKDYEIEKPTLSQKFTQVWEYFYEKSYIWIYDSDINPIVKCEDKIPISPVIYPQLQKYWPYDKSQYIHICKLETDLKGRTLITPDGYIPIAAQSQMQKWLSSYIIIDEISHCMIHTYMPTFKNKELIFVPWDSLAMTYTPLQAEEVFAFSLSSIDDKQGLLEFGGYTLYSWLMNEYLSSGDKLYTHHQYYGIYRQLMYGLYISDSKNILWDIRDIYDYTTWKLKNPDIKKDPEEMIRMQDLIYTYLLQISWEDYQHLQEYFSGLRDAIWSLSEIWDESPND